MVIELNNVTKKFEAKAIKNALSITLGFLNSKNKSKTIKALNNVSFEISSGEIVGIVGNNGAGKSTLLKIISDIYRQDEGTVKVKGKVIPINGAFNGLNNRLTMADNILTRSSLYGLGLKNINRMIKKVAQFSELEEYLHEPLYKFSSGMIARLIFSIAVNCIENTNTRILLLDEIFAVGDIDFKNKSLAKLREFINSDLTIIIASHDLDIIQNECNRCILFDQGKLIKDGNTEETIKYYKFST